MPITEIPPRSPVPPPAARSDGGDLYDARRWESAYRELHASPALIVQLQDELSYSRQREAFWISVVVHLVAIIIIVNSQKLERFLPRRPVIVVSPNDWMRQKDLTYLELPPDEQKVSKRPNTDKISDKDRIATSRSPQLDPKELQKILDSARPGRPGRQGGPQDQAPPPGATPDSQQPQQQAEDQSVPPRLQPDQNQVARLQPPPAPKPQPNFNTGSLSAGSAIDQAMRAALANRQGVGGDQGDYGLGQGRQATHALGELETLSDTMGVDFGPYLSRVLHDVRENWYRIIPESAQAPIMKKGKVSIEFAITKDGRIADLQTVSTSGDIALDRAAIGGITASNPFPPLPAEFRGKFLALRFHFFYNPDSADLQ